MMGKITTEIEFKQALLECVKYMADKGSTTVTVEIPVEEKNIEIGLYVR